MDLWLGVTVARHGVGKVEEVEKGGKGKTAHDAILHSSLKLQDQRPLAGCSVLLLLL